MAFGAMAQTSDITFRVDMRGYSGAAYTTVNLNGTFNGWCGGCNPMTDANNDSIWEVTLPLQVGAIIEYKFTVDGWTGQENLPPNGTCVRTLGGFTNRLYTVTTTTTLDAVCWNSCNVCNAPPPPSYPVTFRVDMRGYTGPAYTTVNLNGSFNGWCGGCNAMTDANNDSIYEITLPLQAGGIEYKFTVDGWTGQEMFQQGMSCTQTNSGFTNRYTNVSGATTLDAVCWNSCTPCSSPAATYDVTFKVDMRGYTGPAYNTVNINGTFNGWCGGCNVMTDANNDSIYEITLPLQAMTIEYKFTVDGWNGQENLTAGTSCVLTTGPFTNRVYTVAATATLPAVCWNSCNVCAPPTYPVTFKVDMRQYTGAAYSGVFVNGTFNGWCGSCNPMTDANNDSIWEVSLPLPSGALEYKFTLDGWNISENLTPGGACVITTGGFTNRSLNVSGSTTLDAVCWESCSACVFAAPTFATTFKVDMRGYSGPAYTTVNVNGTFNGWCGACNPMTDANNDSIWEVTLPLQAGTIEYKFTVDGWTGQENLTPGGSCVLTTGGFTNRVYTIAAASSLNAVCWNSCAVCTTAAPTPVNVTFKVDMSDYNGAAFTGVFVNGTFNGWCGACNPMTDANNDSIWEVTLPLLPGTIEYKFTLDGWNGQESLTPGSSCTQTNFGFTNRVLTFTGATTLDPVCYGTCAPCLGIPVSANVTFRVNMNNYTGSIGQVNLNGNFNGWCGSCAVMTDPDNDGIYALTVNVPTAGVEYLFTVNGWAVAEAMTPGSSCVLTTGPYTNRYLVPTRDTILPAVCWQSCSVCPTGTNLSGTIVYDNSAQAPLSNCVVRLVNAQGASVMSATTNSAGQYQFTQAPSGTYTLQTTTNRTWGGVNSTDALNVARHFSNTQLLSGIRINAADVNASNSINATDALQISRRTVSQISSFTAGNWHFQSPTVTLSGGVLQQGAIKGICIGDVNGSFNPGARTSTGVVFDSRLETSSTLPSGTLAIVAPESMHLGAVTLHISIPTHLGAARFSSEVLGRNLVWNQEQGVLHVSWYDLEGVQISAGNTLGYISFENTLDQADFSSIRLIENSELANVQAEPLQNALLRLAGNTDLAYFSAVAYPNPSRGASTIALSIAQNSEVRYVLSDLMGRTIIASDWTAFASGKHNLSIDMPSAGQYLLNIVSRNSAGSESKTLRITRLP